MAFATTLRNPHERLFLSSIVAFILICAAFYPSTYAIEDEFNILSLALTLTKGTVFLDRAGLDLDADVLWQGHRISKFSPFHAALLTPAVVSDWRLAFAITMAFALAGAFILRGMLTRHGLSSRWVALYFLCAGLWFYSRTLMAAVPASVMVLAGASFLVRDAPRPGAAGASLSLAGLFHPWMIPVSAALAVGWWSDAPRERLRALLLLAAAAAPGAALLLGYNLLTTGSPFVNAYSLLGTQYGFKGENLATFAPLYSISLLLMPIGGWAAFAPRWSGGRAIPCAVATVVVMASMYYFRDGIGYGVAGLLPGQRFLLPASMLACLPAARFLAARTAATPALSGAARFAPAAALAVFVVGFLAVSAGHDKYLDAHASVQRAIQTSIPSGARVLVGERAFKEFAPVLGPWNLKQIRGEGAAPDSSERRDAYVVWIGAPGSEPPQGWVTASSTRMPVRSWVWNRDVFIDGPVHSGLNP